MDDRKLLGGRYELRRLPIARGGMGDVWEGRDTRLDREIAVKFLRFPDGVADDELIRRFVRESRITARLQHPGVPAIFDVGTDDGRPFLVMQRINGTSVADLLTEHGRLPIGWAAAIAAQTCAVLAEAHQASLVHRDLKPANLMLEADGTVKVLDFGLAVAMDAAEVSQITRSGQTIGTPPYMAPEQVLAAMSGPRTDLYALGCTLHETLTGRQLFTGSTSYTVMNQQVDEVPPSARELRPDVPASLDALLRSLLAKNPDDRPVSARAVYEALRPFATDAGPVPGARPPSAEPSPARMYADVVSRVFAGPVAAETSPEPEPPRSGEGSAEPARPREVTRRAIDSARADASALLRDSRFSEAAHELGELVDAARETFGATDHDVINLRLEWANVLFEGGDYRSAAPVYQELVRDLAERDGPEAELVFRCRMQYATCHAELGDTDIAVPAMRELLLDERRVYGPTDPRTIELRRQLGMLELGSGQREAARQTLTDLLDDLRHTFGSAHPATPKIEDLLAGIPAA